MNMIRVSHHDLPNPAKRITELEAELLRVRAALEDQHASTDALWNENTALRADRDALRARLAELEAAAQALVSVADRAQVEIDHNQFEQTAGDLSEAIDAMRAALPDAGGALADGWRLLEVGEVVLPGDQYYDCAICKWISCGEISGVLVEGSTIRRRMSAQRAAPLPAPAAENGETK